MPNRIIKESIRESDSIDKLSPHAEVLFYRLITYADDYGLFKADPRIVNPAIFPLKGYKEKQVIEWMDEIGTAGMIAFYRAGDGKPYGTFTSWEKHQQIRNNKSKYPSPDGCKQEISISILLKSIEINCNQLTAVAPVILIQSNPIHKRSFDTFWKAYPKRVAKQEAVKAFTKLNPDGILLEVILKGIDASKKSEAWLKDGGKFIPHPASWLNGRRWEDELTSPPATKPELTLNEKFRIEDLKKVKHDGI